MTEPDHLDVVAVGNALVDVLVHDEEALLDKLELAKGTMSLVDWPRACHIYDSIGPGVEMSGGSVANTATGLVSLGGKAAFIGTVGDDQLGTIFRHDLQATGVVCGAVAAGPGVNTGCCLVLVTPDGQRTMATHLGVAGALAPGSTDLALVEAATITFVEGYLVGLPTAAQALEEIIAAARTAGRRVALTLSDPQWVAAQRRRFGALLADVDVLLANEAEACELTGETDAEAAVHALGRSCEVVAVTRSEQGAYVTDGSTVVAVPAEPVPEVVDTTGAGDLFAAGFLLGTARSLPLEGSARLGALAAAQILGHLGARPQRPLAELAASAGLL